MVSVSILHGPTLLPGPRKARPDPSFNDLNVESNQCSELKLQSAPVAFAAERSISRQDGPPQHIPSRRG